MQDYNSIDLHRPTIRDKMAPLLKILVISLLLIFLSGCERWQRKANEIPKEVPVSRDVQEVEIPKEVEISKKEESPSSTVNKNQEQEKQNAVSNSTKKISVTVEYTDKSKSWETKDEMLVQNIAELLLIKNEEFYNPLDLRPYDFDAIITDREGTKESYHLWVNFIKENEVIVENENGKQWNLSIMDSHALRKILQSLS